MDPLSVTTGALSIVGNIVDLTITISIFMRQVRDARNDLDAVLRELISLKSTLEILAEDVSGPEPHALPESLSTQVQGILRGCDSVVMEIAKTLSKFEGNGIILRSQWAITGRSDMEKLRSSLEAHKTALNIVLDMLSL